MRPRAKAIGLVLRLLAVLAAAGCGSSGTIDVTGKLLKAGTPYRPAAGQDLGVTLYALDAGKSTALDEPYPAQYDSETGTFHVPGPDGRGIPPGRYRVAIVQKRTREAIDAAAASGKKADDRDTDFLKDAFGPKSSPIIRELTVSCDLAIDLDAPTVAGLSP
jgi:hypothetical protein